MSNIFGPNPSGAGVIDRLLGTAYQSVKIVADQIDVIKEIAANIPAIKDAARNMARKIVVIEADGGALGTTTYTALPDGLTEADVLDSVVVIVAANGDVYSESTGHFSTVVAAGYLETTVNTEAPTALANATIRWTLSYSD